MTNCRWLYALCVALIALPLLAGGAALAADKAIKPPPRLKSCSPDKLRYCNDLYNRCKNSYFPSSECMIMLPVCAKMCEP